MSSAGIPSPATHNGAADLAFVSVIAWPSEFSVEGTVARMAAASGLDEPTLQLQARKTAPAILARVPLVAAQRALAALIECGGDGFCPTMKQIEALGPTIKMSRCRTEVSSSSCGAASHSRSSRHSLRFSFARD